MKKINVIEGQIDIFSMTAQEPIRQKNEKVIIEKPKAGVKNFENIINLYKNTCSRIVKTVSGALLVELEDKTLYFNKECKHEFDLSRNVGLIPADEIILVNKDKELNEVQLKKLKELNPRQYIKRKGENNIIIPTESKTIVITTQGWILEWNMKPLYKEDELFTFGSTLIELQENQELKVGDKVEFIYKEQNCIGKIVRIYNDGNTVNISWNGKHTALYYKCVKKIA